MSNKLKHRGETTESFLTTLHHFFRNMTDYVICIYMILIIAVMPFYFRDGFNYIGTDKHLFLKGCIQKIGPILIVLVVCQGICALIQGIQNHKDDFIDAAYAWLTRWNVTDVFVLLYGVAVFLSYAGSRYKQTALWGSQNWYMGLIPQLSMVVCYFCISRLWKKRDWIFLLFLPASAVVFALGILNRFGIYPIDMKLKNPSFISTIGNINWYCGYLVSVLFAGVYLLWQSKKKISHRILYSIYVAIGFATLVTQGSMSGFLALGMVLLVLFAMSARDAECMKMFWWVVFMLGGVCTTIWWIRSVKPDNITYQDRVMNVLTKSAAPLGLVALSIAFLVLIRVAEGRGNYPAKFFHVLTMVAVGGAIVAVVTIIGMIAYNTVHPGSLGRLSDNPFFTFSPAWGSSRGATWEAGLMCLKEERGLQKLIGVGPDCMEMFINKEGSLQLLGVIQTWFGALRLTNAHCELLTIWINVGLLGAVSFAGILISAGIRFLKAGRKAPIASACGICALAYMTNNLVSFQQSMSLATIFVILGIGGAYLRLADKESV